MASVDLQPHEIIQKAHSSYLGLLYNECLHAQQNAGDYQKSARFKS